MPSQHAGHPTAHEPVRESLSWGERIEGKLDVQGQTPIWIPLLAAALARGPEQVDPTGMHVTIAYHLVPGRRADLVGGLAELLVFLSVAVADAADNPSWRSGGRVGRATWERLLQEDSGDYPAVKSFIGEALAWWHEEQTPTVAYAQRPFPRTSQPVIDSLSLLECGDGHAVRGVQAKATYGGARARMNEALGGFEELQRGEHDEFWAEAVRRFDLELRGAGASRFDMAGVASGESLLHFCVFVCHAELTVGDPARGYHPRITADPPHGRAAAFVHDPQMDALVREVAAAVRARVFA